MVGTRYVALLKGINVGKAKRVAMTDLVAMLNGLGYADVVTHLQSGNAAFTAAGTPGTIVTAIESGLRSELGVAAAVVVRTNGQLAAAVQADPFGEIADDPARHLLGFLSGRPAAAQLAAFEAFVEAKHVDPEVGGRHRIVGDHCYLWCPQGVLKSLFGTVDWDRRLGVTVTMRNFSTVRKLLEMSG